MKNSTKCIVTLDLSRNPDLDISEKEQIKALPAICHSHGEADWGPLQLEESGLLHPSFLWVLEVVLRDQVSMVLPAVSASSASSKVPDLRSHHKPTEPESLGWCPEICSHQPSKRSYALLEFRRHCSRLLPIWRLARRNPRSQCLRS